MRHPYVAAFFAVLALGSGVAMASKIGAGGGGGVGAAVDVLGALVGQDVNANSYTATTTTGPAFISTGDRVDAVKLGTGARASIGTCNGGAICLGPSTGNSTGVYVSGFIVSTSQQVQGELDLLGDNAYLRNNSGAVNVRDTDGLSINDTTPVKGVVLARVTFDFPSITNNACSTQSVTVTGAALQDYVKANADFALPADVSIGNARVTSANTVELKLCNHSSTGPQDPASGAYNFEIMR